MANHHQSLLPISFTRNRGLLSNHWFENRLTLEPEWENLRAESLEALNKLAALWDRERNRVEKYETEAPLEHAFIQPVLEILGWKLIYQTFLAPRKPDYALFMDDRAKDASLAVERKSLDFWKTVTVVADAKAWHVPLNRPSMIDSAREYPPQQIESYLDKSRLDFGILTNGGIWRLIPREHEPYQRRFQTYLECDLAKLLENLRTARTIHERQPLEDDFHQFYLFFGPSAFRRIDPLQPLIRRAIEGSSEYRVGAGEGLKERAFEALRLCIEGYLSFEENDLHQGIDLEQCREESFVFLYRLLFIMFAEDRRLLPYRKDRNYTDNRSLGRKRDEIATMLRAIKDGSAPEYSNKDATIWEDLNSLFDLVNGGHKRYQVPEFNGGLFDPEAHPFLADKKISDYYLARVIDQLGQAEEPSNPNAGLFRVDYRDLAIQHLGAIYEGLLELQPEYALTDMVVISRRVQGRLEESYLAESERVPTGWRQTETRYRKGTIFLRTKKGERRTSGSYYTPDHIVNHIVDNTLGPLFKATSDQLEREIEAATREAENAERVKALSTDYANRILRLKILDPAMGSAHFLIRACQKIAEEIATHPRTPDPAGDLDADVSSVSYWKRRVVEHCLYGVDLNSLAVELGKLALWLETVAGDEPLSFLNHHLHHGNSLVGGKIAEMGNLPAESALVSQLFGEQVETKLSAILDPLNRINAIASDTAPKIKEKERAYREYERAREPFRIVGDLWCAAFCPGSRIVAEEYQRAIQDLEHPRRFAALSDEQWFTDGIAVARDAFGRPFHWELEFPEVFFEGPRAALMRGLTPSSAIRRTMCFRNWKPAAASRRFGLSSTQARATPRPGVGKTTSIKSSCARRWSCYATVAISDSSRRWQFWATIKPPKSAARLSPSVHSRASKPFRKRTIQTNGCFPKQNFPRPRTRSSRKTPTRRIREPSSRACILHNGSSKHRLRLCFRHPRFRFMIRRTSLSSVAHKPIGISPRGLWGRGEWRGSVTSRSFFKAKSMKRTNALAARYPPTPIRENW